MASPDHDVSCRGGYVGPHRHLEDQTDHLLLFCHLSSPERNTTLTLLGRFAARAGFVTPRQTFVRRCQSCLPWVAVSCGGARPAGFRPLCNHLKIPVMVGCAPSADAITAALAPAGWTPTLLGNSGRCLVGALHAVVAARRPAHRAPLAGLSGLCTLPLVSVASN